MSGETVTRDELAGAWKRLHFDESCLPAMLADIEAHREAEYVPGSVYQDAAGGVWVYVPRADDSGCCWLKPGEAGVWSRGTPVRPLRRLVPEWSPALPDVKAIAGVITEWTDARHDVLEAAMRIRKMIMEAAL